MALRRRAFVVVAGGIAAGSDPLEDEVCTCQSVRAAGTVDHPPRSAPITDTYATDPDGIAVAGFDPVTYRDPGGPTKGTSAHERTWGGATWRFGSSENAAIFELDPERFAPMAAGKCAFGGSVFGRDADASPDAFRIIDDRVYLFMDKKVRGLSKLFTSKIKRTYHDA